MLYYTLQTLYGKILRSPARISLPHLSQLHEAVHDAQKVARRHRRPHLDAVHVLLVQLSLALGQPACHLHAA
mgnify:CR=1 FL=1